MTSYLPSPCPSGATHNSSSRAPSTNLNAIARLGAEEGYTEEFIQELESKHNQLPIRYVTSSEFYRRLEDEIHQMNSDDKQDTIEKAAERVAHQLAEENDMAEKEYSRVPYHDHIWANLYNPEYNLGKAFPFCVISLKSFLSHDLERLVVLLQHQKDRTTASRQRQTTPQQMRRSKRLQERDKTASRQRRTTPQQMRRSKRLQKRDEKRVCK